MKLDVGRVNKAYLLRREEFIDGMDVSADTDLGKKHLANLALTDLAYQNLIGLIKTVSEILKEEVIKEATSDAAATDMAMDATELLSDEVDDLTKSSPLDKKVLLRKIENEQLKLVALNTRAKFRELLQVYLQLVIIQSTDTAFEIFNSRDTERIKSAIKKFLMFLATLDPFVSGANAIRETLNAQVDAAKSANNYLRQLDAYGNSCLMHSASSKYLVETARAEMASSNSVELSVDSFVDAALDEFGEIINSYKET